MAMVTVELKNRLDRKQTKKQMLQDYCSN